MIPFVWLILSFILMQVMMCVRRVRACSGAAVDQTAVLAALGGACGLARLLDVMKPFLPTLMTCPCSRR